MGDRVKGPDGQWAIDLLTRDVGYKKQFYNIYFSQIFLGTGGFFAPLSANWWLNRPILTHFPHAIYGCLIGVTLGTLLTNVLDRFYGQRDAMALDYIKQHPDRFPEPENRKYADIFEPWVPLR